MSRAPSNRQVSKLRLIPMFAMLGSLASLFVTLVVLLMTKGGGFKSLLLLLPLLIAVAVTTTSTVVFAVWTFLLPANRAARWLAVGALLSLVGLAIALYVAMNEDNWRAERLGQHVEKLRNGIVVAVRDGKVADFKALLEECGKYCQSDGEGAEFYGGMLFNVLKSDHPDAMFDVVLGATGHPERPLASNTFLKDPAITFTDGDFDCRGVERRTANLLQVAIWARPDEWLRRLLRHASFDEKQLALAYAVEADRPDRLAMIVSAGAKPLIYDDAMRGANGSLKRSLIDVAIRAHAPRALEWLITVAGLPVEGVPAAESVTRSSSMHVWAEWASSHQYAPGQFQAMLAVLAVLHAHGSRFNDVEDNFSGKITPLGVSILSDAPLVVAALIERGAKPALLSAEERSIVNARLEQSKDPVWLAAFRKQARFDIDLLAPGCPGAQLNK